MPGLLRNRRLQDALAESELTQRKAPEVPLDIINLDAQQPLRVYNVDNPDDMAEYNALVNSPEFKQRVAEQEEEHRARKEAEALMEREAAAPTLKLVQDLWRRYQALRGNR